MAKTILSPGGDALAVHGQNKPWLEIPGVGAAATDNYGEAKKVFIFCHGMRANREFFTPVGDDLRKLGYACLYLPMQGHNGNADNEIGFGVKESKMIRSVLDVVKGDKIVLVGCSMGGASVWMASDHPRVSGIVSESAYSRLRPTTVTWLSRFGSWGSVVWAPVIKLCQWRTNINPDDVNPIEFAEKWDRSKPALVIHAGEDKLIPKSQGEELAKASSADYWEVPGASHANCQFQQQEYVNRLDAIMKRL